MKTLKWLPLGLSVLFSVSTLFLWWAVSNGRIRIAELSVVLSLFSVMLIFLNAAIASIMCALLKFRTYWQSAYPVIHAVMLFGLSVLALPNTLGVLPMMSAVLVACYVSLIVSPPRWDRFVPLLTLVLFLSSGEFFFSLGEVARRYLPSFATLYGASMMLVTWMRQRRLLSQSHGRPSA